MMKETSHPQETPAQRQDDLSIVCHELRTPLTAMQAAIKLIASGSLGDTTPDQQQMLALAIKNIERMGRLVTTLLDISKSEAGRLTLHRESIEFTSLIRDTVRTFLPLARERGLTLRAEISQMAVDLFADRDKIVQVLSNLIHNALKFTSEGGVTLTLNTPGDYLECRVSDTGAGIAPKDLPRLFSKFAQFHKHDAAKERGTGLGLALTKKLIELHDGTIEVQSKPGEGTTFSFLLPKIAPEFRFKEKALQLLQETRGSERSCSFIHLHMLAWDSALKTLGYESAATLMIHLEGLVKASLRDDLDVIVQTRGAFWLALPHVERHQAKEIAARIKASLAEDILRRQMHFRIGLEVKVITYPIDIQSADDLLAFIQ